MTSYLDSLDREQRAAAEYKNSPLAVMAGAGSGKTKLITARIAHQVESGVDPSALLVSAFTRASSKEMSERVGSILEKPEISESLDVSTFHSLMFRWHNGYREAAGLEPFGVLKEGQKKFLFEKWIAKPSRDYPFALNVANADLGAIMSWISLWKNQGYTHDSEEIKATLEDAAEGSDIHSAAKLYPHYEDHLVSNNLMDFDDMLFKTFLLVDRNPEAAEAIRERWNAGVFIDEAQDTNRIQWSLIEAIAPPDESPNVTVVGDLRQCLFGFRGSDPTAFEGFTNRYKDAAVIDLINNYRCSGKIVKAANKLASGMHMVDQKSIRDQGENVEVRTFSSPNEQAIAITEEILAAKDKDVRGGDFAVLVRTNAQSAPIETAFVKAGLPYWCNGGGFFDRMEVGDLMAYLRVANDSTRTDLLKRIINRPTRYLGAAFVEAVEGNLSKYGGDILKAIRLTDSYNNRKLSPKQRQGAVDLSDLLRDLREGDVALSPSIALQKVMKLTDYEAWLRKHNGLSEDADSQRMDNINALIVEATKFTSIKSFLEFADESSRLQFKSDDSTHILTVHRAKGLEWPTVWVTNMFDGSIPHNLAKREDGGYLSEQRVAYVAMTRAEDRLVLGVPTIDDKGNEVRPSPFLHDAGLNVD